MLAFAFGLTAELSKKLLQERVQETLNRLKQEGKKLGRPLGAKSKELKLSKNKKKVIDLLNKETPKAHIARIMKIHKSTLYAFLKQNGLF